MSAARNLLLTGGIVHPFESAAPALAGVLRRHGIESTVTEDIEGGLADLARDRFDLLTIYALRWSMKDDNTRPPRAMGADAIVGGACGDRYACTERRWPAWRSYGEHLLRRLARMAQLAGWDLGMGAIRSSAAVPGRRAYHQA